MIHVWWPFSKSMEKITNGYKNEDIIWVQMHLTKILGKP